MSGSWQPVPFYHRTEHCCNHDDDNDDDNQEEEEDDNEINDDFVDDITATAVIVIVDKIWFFRVFSTCFPQKSAHSHKQHCYR